MRKLHDLEMRLDVNPAWSFTRAKTPTQIVQEVFYSEKRKLKREEEARKKAEAARRRQITLNGLARLKEKKSR
jgi:O-succinylbenzoate synthase